MVCEICKKNEAKVHLSNIEGGEVRKVDLCEACAKAKGVDDAATYSLANLLLGLGVATEPDEPAATGAELRCPSCGFTQADFKKMGRLGCPECYGAFAEPLRGLLKTMHKGSRHVGKVPHGFRPAQNLTDRLKGLQKKLDKAVAAEDFEAAATLRDEMKHLKEEGGPAPAE
ncbi:MAG: UvrB/UvrC motif-containing protein [Verrucomicrobia bacterium]|nr:UvrB/UvrC motif-containing protein [Verrucomicrobiota bacterium]